MELSQSRFCEASEALDSIDVVRPESKLVVSVIDSAVALVAEIDQPIVATPFIRMQDRSQTGLFTNHRLQHGLEAFGTISV